MASVLDSGSDPSSRWSPPQVVAAAVLKAATARRPRTRYVVGLGARPILVARRALPDRSFDRLMRVSYWFVRRM